MRVMDEQTIQQSTANQAADAGYEASSGASVEPDYGYAGEGENIAEPYEDGSEDEYASSEGEIEPEGARLDDEGNVRFGDKFFGDIHDTPPSEPEAPKWYSPDELRNTPYEQWDVERLHGDIKEFVPIVREQLQARQRHEQLSRVPEVPEFLEAPHQYTPKELAEEAQRLACERLGLEDPEDFDEYEGEHRAAQQMAMQELIQKQMADSQAYETGKTEWVQLQRFNAELASQPDFEDFNRWYMSKLQAKGVTAQQVNAGLYEYARRNGNRFGLIPQVIGSWYREYQGERGRARQAGYDAQTSRYPQDRTGAKRPTPPVLESSGGNDYGGRRRVNLQTFGDMDSEEQASALMRMGVV